MLRRTCSIFLAFIALSSSAGVQASNPSGTFNPINQTTAVASGQASDADRSGQSILIDFWLGSGFTTYVGETATLASSGNFTFQIPVQYRDGQPRSFCAWAINDSGPHINLGCKSFAQAPTAPTGSLSEISASGVASGTASDTDRAGQSILVDFWIEPGFTTYVGETATQGTTGAFTFQIPAQYHDGQPRSFCAWGIDNAGAHTNLGCKSFAYVDHLPAGLLSSVDSNAVARGSARDPDLPSQEVEVHFYRGQGFESSNYLGKTTTNGGNFTFSIPSSNRIAGEICAYAINTAGPDNPRIGCVDYVKPGLKYFGYYTSSTPFRLGQGDYTEEVTDHTNLAWIESNDCAVIAASEDRQYCNVPPSQTVNRQDYLETLPGSGRTIDFFDLMSRVDKARVAGDKAMLHIEQFLFVFPSGTCFYLRTDADAIIQAVSRQLNKHDLMDTVVGVYPIDEPYLRAADPNQGVCRSSTDRTPFPTTAERNVAVYQIMNQVLASIRASDVQSGLLRFAGKKTALVMSYVELEWPDAVIPSDYDWIGYDGYIATGEVTQDYGHYLGLLKQKISTLPNAGSKNILLVPEAYVPDTQYPPFASLDEAFYSSSALAPQCSAEVTPPSNFIPIDDGHRRAECILLSNFLKAYRLALCDPTIVAIVPFLWQGGMNAEFPSGDTKRYRDLTNYLVAATLTGSGVSTPPYAFPVPSCPAQ